MLLSSLKRYIKSGNTIPKKGTKYQFSEAIKSHNASPGHSFIWGLPRPIFAAAGVFTELPILTEPKSHLLLVAIGPTFAVFT